MVSSRDIKNLAIQLRSVYLEDKMMFNVHTFKARVNTVLKKYGGLPEKQNDMLLATAYQLILQYPRRDIVIKVGYDSQGMVGHGFVNEINIHTQDIKVY